ncbi:MAG: CPBP family intramembrane metalloprotease [Leptolyngbya sp. SIO4C1]|nr:CPBP family intramembrane metalloprotease [Leptolyngbya sp. SIO4C1]
MVAIPNDRGLLGQARTFWTLWLLGMAGVFSLLLVALPVEGLSAVPGLSLIQPIVLLTVMTWLGARLASQVGLRLPLITALYERRRVGPVLRSQLLTASVATLAVFIAMLLIQAWAEPQLPAAYLAVNENAETLLPPVTRFLYGGITEEILMRWGLMTLLVWLPWKLFQKGSGAPQPIFFWGAILVTALLFGVGHLPLLFSLVPQVSGFLVAYIVGLNALVGIAAGWLYWQHGLEAAMMAHILFHVLGLVIQ